MLLFFFFFFFFLFSLTTELGAVVAGALVKMVSSPMGWRMELAHSLWPPALVQRKRKQKMRLLLVCGLPAQWAGQVSRGRVRDLDVD